jgi:hypothetical protein
MLLSLLLLEVLLLLLTAVSVDTETSSARTALEVRPENWNISEAVARNLSGFLSVSHLQSIAMDIVASFLLLLITWK